MKRLYVSDLDGTLFNSEKAISKFSANIINQFIDGGGLFSIATARTAYGCDYKLKSLRINVPVIIMNGVCLYSLKDKKYVDVQTVDNSKVPEIENILNEHNIGGFMYTYNNDSIGIFYKREADLQYTQYYSQRAIDECSEIRRVERFTSEVEDKEVIYFALTGEKSIIEKIWSDINRITGIKTALYLNIYNGLYCLEVFDGKGSKDNALKKLKEILNVDEVVVFGDNHNDVSMMQIADKSFAPENAVPEVKIIVDGIIGSCDEDGVAIFIQNLL